MRVKLLNHLNYYLPNEVKRAELYERRSGRFLLVVPSYDGDKLLFLMNLVTKTLHARLYRAHPERSDMQLADSVWEMLKDVYRQTLNKFETEETMNLPAIPVGAMVWTEHQVLEITSEPFCHYPGYPESHRWWAYHARKSNGINTLVYDSTIKGMSYHELG